MTPFGYLVSTAVLVFGLGLFGVTVTSLHDPDPLIREEAYVAGRSAQLDLYKSAYVRMDALEARCGLRTIDLESVLRDVRALEQRVSKLEPIAVGSESQ